MANPANARAARRRIKIPNPLKAVDDVWKAAAGPTNWPAKPKPSDATGPPIQLAGTRPRRRRGAAGYNKGTGPD